MPSAASRCTSADLARAVGARPLYLPSPYALAVLASLRASARAAIEVGALLGLDRRLGLIGRVRGPPAPGLTLGFVQGAALGFNRAERRISFGLDAARPAVKRRKNLLIFE